MQAPIPRRRDPKVRKKREIFSHLRELKQAITEDRLSTGAAALAYYLTLAIFPSLILLFAVIPYLPIDNIDQAAMDLLGQALPGDAASLLSGTVRDIATQKRGALLSFGALGLLWAASGGTYALMQELNAINEVRESRPIYKARGIAAGLTLWVGALLLTAFALVVLGGQIQQWLISSIGAGALLRAGFALIRWIIILLAFFVAFSSLYRFGPDMKGRFRPITPGAGVAVLIVVGASLLFRTYVASFGNYNATYGALGGAIVLMLWLYLTGFAILLGAVVDRTFLRSKEKTVNTGPSSLRLVRRVHDV
ncbi:MAG: hypothetical protein A2X94_10525 [Bdellovibrionales bacterium GWB1_55_8]|nr:MAG: hypothetical protein A2X94_10525 [Bdellovibrionales bacterium GWB1_55_8]